MNDDRGHELAGVERLDLPVGDGPMGTDLAVGRLGNLDIETKREAVDLGQCSRCVIDGGEPVVAPELSHE